MSRLFSETAAFGGVVIILIAVVAPATVIAVATADVAIPHRQLDQTDRGLAARKGGQGDGSANAATRRPDSTIRVV